MLIARANPKFSVDRSEADLWFCYGPAHGAGQCPAGGWWPDQALPGAVQGITDAACFPYTPANQAGNRCGNAPARLSSITSWHSITTPVGRKAFLAGPGLLQTCFSADHPRLLR